MSDKERLVRFTLLRQEYAFYTGASEEEMEKILSLVKKLIEEGTGGSTSGTIPVSKAAIMACLNIASQFIKLKQDFEDYKRKSDMKACGLIEQIDACLLSEKKEGDV